MHENICHIASNDCKIPSESNYLICWIEMCMKSARFSLISWQAHSQWARTLRCTYITSWPDCWGLSHLISDCIYKTGLGVGLLWQKPWRSIGIHPSRRQVNISSTLATKPWWHWRRTVLSAATVVLSSTNTYSPCCTLGGWPQYTPMARNNNTLSRATFTMGSFKLNSPSAYIPQN